MDPSLVVGIVMGAIYAALLGRPLLAAIWAMPIAMLAYRLNADPLGYVMGVALYMFLRVDT